MKSDFLKSFIFLLSFQSLQAQAVLLNSVLCIYSLLRTVYPYPKPAFA